jgi:hypothetical protein
MLGTLDCRQIEDLLHAEVVGRIGCHTSGRTYVVPITYAYDGAAVYGHCFASCWERRQVDSRSADVAGFLLRWNSGQQVGTALDDP